MVISLNRTYVLAEMQDAIMMTWETNLCPLMTSSIVVREPHDLNSWGQENCRFIDSFNWLVFRHRRRSTVSSLKIDDRVSAQNASPKKHPGQNDGTGTINEYFRIQR